MPAKVVHFEIGCRDAAKNKEFYARLLGWEFQAFGPSVQMVMNTAGANSIGGHLNQLGHEPHNYTVFYAEVDDLKKTIDQASKLGGKQVVPPTEVPGMGHFAWISDPEGNMLGLWKAAPQG